MPSLVVIGLQIKEKRGGGGQNNVPPPAYMVKKDPSLNRVKLPKIITNSGLQNGSYTCHGVALHAGTRELQI